MGSWMSSVKPDSHPSAMKFGAIDPTPEEPLERRVDKARHEYRTPRLAHDASFSAGSHRKICLLPFHVRSQWPRRCSAVHFDQSSSTHFHSPVGHFISRPLGHLSALITLSTLGTQAKP